jgi:hypothetical protein
MVCALLLVTNLTANSGEFSRARHLRDIPADLNRDLGISHTSRVLLPSVQVGEVCVVPPDGEAERMDNLLQRMDEMELLEREVLEFPPQPRKHNVP